MSAAEDAYQAAEAAIEEAKRTGAETLDFSGEAFNALETLPPGISALDGLRTLILDKTQVSDLAPLQGLTGLQTLWLKATRVSDLAPLRGLTGLRDLRLGHTQVSNLAPLRGLTGLQILLLDATQVSDLAPLQGLAGLQTLLLDTTQVSDLAPLVGMTGLETLTLDYTRVSDLVPLAGMTRLRMLSLDYTRVSDLVPLSGLTGLVSLSLKYTQVGDLEPLARLTRLGGLILNGTQVSDLAPLAGLTRLGGLLLDGTKVSDLIPLAGLTGLQTLWLEGTKVSDLGPLAELTKLGDIRISDTQVSDLAPLAGLTGLRGLRLDGTQVSDLSPLAMMAGMKRLWLHNTRVSDLTPLMGMTEMVTLSLGATQVLDLRPLRGLHKLAYEPRNSGLTFSDIPATTDPKIARIAEIKDDAARTKVLFALLDADWVPPVLNHQTMIPEQVPAPIEAEVNAQGVLVERPASPSLTGEQDARARAGWVALRELQMDAIDTLCKDNLPSLRRAIHAFGRALGEDYGAMNVIALGTHGRRIVEMSKTVDNALLEDAAGDLVAFAAAIHLHLQRFPEWIAYLRDTEEAAPEGPPVAVSGPQLRVILAVMTGAEDVDPALARKFGDLVEGAEEAETVDAAAKLGVLRSLSNILVPLARQVLAGARRLGGDLLGETYKKGIAGTVLAGMGVGSDLIFNKGQVLLALARDYPKTLGWLTQVLRALGIS